jgi:glutaredoxin
MNATKKLAISLILLIAASIFTFGALYDKKTPAENPQTGNLVFYYGSTCPHCKTVEDYLKQNDPENKLDIAQKEAWDNQANADEYVEKATACGIFDGKITVPMLWDGNNSKCYIGDQPIIDFIKQLGTN